jgi:hypothetical protein
MRHRTFDTGKNSPFFRPPKYTGITLSLLSIFVLVSMLAVWEKMVQTPNLPNLRILAWDSAKLPLERIRKVYQQEAQCIVTIQYQNQSEILESIISKNISTDSTWDVLILPASQDFDELLDLDGWTGVDQDHWDLSPRLKIYAIRESKPWLNHVAEDFAQREGLALDISFLEKDHLEASVRLLSQANHKDYLPDLVSLPAEDNPPEWVGDFYLKFEQAPIDGLPMCCIYIRKKSPLFKTSQRFLHYLSKTK